MKTETTLSRAAALDKFLSENNAVCLRQFIDKGYRIEVMIAKGKMFMVTTHYNDDKLTGWDVLIPVGEDNKIATTLDATAKYLNA